VSLGFKNAALQVPGWLSQLSVHPTLDPGSGLDLRVVSPSPVLGSMLGVEPT